MSNDEKGRVVSNGTNSVAQVFRFAGRRHQLTSLSIESAAQIRGLLEAGMPTTIIRDILPCLSGTGDIYLKKLKPETRRRLERERDRITARIECLTRNRDAIDDYLKAVPLTWPAES